MRTSITAVTAALAFIVSTPAPATADKTQALQILADLHKNDALSKDQQSDGADRMRLASRLAMLTQRVAAASCSVSSDVAVEEGHANLEEAMYEIDIILDALRYGNEALHVLGPEKKRRIVHDIDLLDEEWRETHGAVENVLTNGNDVDSAHVIDDHNLSLLEKAEVIRSDISGAYSHPFEINQADAMLMNIAGRQRTLTQQMAKDACEIWTGYHADQGRADLEKTMVIFENSLSALRDGNSAFGIKPAPTEAIAKDLDHILARWKVIRGNLDLLLAGETLDMDQKYEIIHDFNLELAEIDHLVQDYGVYVEQSFNAAAAASN